MEERANNIDVDVTSPFRTDDVNLPNTEAPAPETNKRPPRQRWSLKKLTNRFAFTTQKAIKVAAVLMPLAAAAVFIGLFISGNDQASIDVSTNHTCTVRPGGHIKCWGNNDDGQLGDRTRESSNVPVDVDDISDATDVSIGPTHSCALLGNGTVECWGALYQGFDDWNESYYFPYTEPRTIKALTDAVAIDSGPNATCAVTGSGSVSCWGSNAAVLQGNTNEITTGHSDAVIIEGISNASDVAVADRQACAVSSGSIKCWNGETENVETVEGVDNAISVAGNQSSICAVLADGTIRCFDSPDSDPVSSERATDAVEVVVNDRSICWLSEAGGLACSDRRTNELGTLFGSDQFDAVAANDGHICAVRNDGTVLCSGANDDGQLGDGTLVNRDDPAPVDGL